MRTYKPVNKENKRLRQLGMPENPPPPKPSRQRKKTAARLDYNGNTGTTGNSTKGGIYEIRNKLNDRVYFHHASEFKCTWMHDLRLLSDNQHPCKALQNDYNLYGPKALVWTVLTIVKPSRPVPVPAAGARVSKSRQWGDAREHRQLLKNQLIKAEHLLDPPNELGVRTGHCYNMPGDAYSRRSKKGTKDKGAKNPIDIRADQQEDKGAWTFCRTALADFQHSSDLLLAQKLEPTKLRVNRRMYDLIEMAQARLELVLKDGTTQPKLLLTIFEALESRRLEREAVDSGNPGSETGLGLTLEGSPNPIEDTQESLETN